MTDFLLDDRLDLTERPRLKSLSWRRNVLLFLLSAYLFFRLYELVLIVLEEHFLNSYLSIVRLHQEYIEINPLAIAFSGATLLFWLSIVFLAIWFYAVFQNLKSARLNTNSSYVMAPIGFFIPIINIVQPYFVMSEAWNASQFLAGEIKAKWRKHPTSYKIYIWWFLFLLGYILTPLFNEWFPSYLFYTVVNFCLSLGMVLLLIHFTLTISRIHQRLIEGEYAFPEPKRG